MNFSQIKLTPGFASIVTHTEPKLTKKNPFNNLIKVSKMEVQLGVNYVNSVSNKGKSKLKDFEWEVEGLKWGSWYNYPYIIEHKGKYYLRVKVFKTLKVFFFDKTTRKVYSLNQVKPFLKSSSNTKQLSKIGEEIFFRNYEISKVKKITQNGKTYKACNFVF